MQIHPVTSGNVTAPTTVVPAVTWPTQTRNRGRAISWPFVIYCFARAVIPVLGLVTMGEVNFR